MTSLKEHFDDFRSNTPKHVQWLLLAVAFLIVIILLTLLLTYKSPTKDNVSIDSKAPEFSFNPNNLEFVNVKVGDAERRVVNVSVTEPVIIDSVEISPKITDFKLSNNCSFSDSATTDSCSINVLYKPTVPQNETHATLVVTWHVESDEEITNNEEIPMLFSAYQEQVMVSEPEEKTPVEEVPEDEEEVIEDDEPDADAIEELKEIAVPNPFPQQPEPAPVQPVPEPIQQIVMPSKQCSQFAIPGYDASGRQIGWIKPERGTNYFYPLSDKTCSNPTGKYDLRNGVITSLKDGSKIGTDAEHIGYRNVRDRNLSIPRLGTPQAFGGRAVSEKRVEDEWHAKDKSGNAIGLSGHDRKFTPKSKDEDDEEKAKILKGTAQQAESVTSSLPYDRTFILRQFKPIPATIVSEVRADPSVYGFDKSGNKIGDDKNSSNNHSIPVRATVDRNVYSDDGRTIILPTGTLLMGYLDGKLPGPYQAFGRMNIRWYQFIRPDGVEFNFENFDQDPYSADAQGRMGVPGHGSTDYVEQMVMPLLTSLVPAAVNMIAPIADTVINQIDLDNNTIVQSGTIRSSEMAKQDVINTWNKITQKLLVDAIDNTVPPFSIAAGTRINVFSPVDLIVSCAGTDGKCSAITPGSDKRRPWSDLRNKVSTDPNDGSWIGQVRSFDLNQYCDQDAKGKWTIKNDGSWAASGYEYRTVLLYCESLNYAAINNAKQAAYYDNVETQSANKYGTAQYDFKTNKITLSDDEDQKKAYNTEVLGLKYDDEGNIMNPFAKPANTVDAADEEILTCDDGKAPDSNGCCTGETFTDMGADGWNCCPDSGGDCFPPLTVE